MIVKIIKLQSSFDQKSMHKTCIYPSNNNVSSHTTMLHILLHILTLIQYIYIAKAFLFGNKHLASHEIIKQSHII